MEFLTPVAGYLALLALPIILFYLLKVRLRQERVSTILFWQQVFEERRTRSIWRRLRHLLSLLINLLFLSLLVFAVLNPVFSSRKKESQTVIIVDNSASMNAVESDRLTRFDMTRLDLAKNTLARYLAGTEVGMQTAIITAGGEPQVVVGFTNHLGTLRKKTEEISATDFPTELTKSIELARHLIAENEDSAILIYTDGCSPEIEKYLNDSKIRFVSVGKPLDNVAITRFQPRRSLGDVVGYEILTEVVNFGQNSVECRLEIDLEDNPVDVIPLVLEPNVPQQIIKKYTTDQGGILKATLDHADAFPVDNTAFALLPARPVQNVLFYGEADFFLSHVLFSQLNVNLVEVDECPAKVPQDTVLVIHRTVPETIPEGNTLVIDPQNSSDMFAVGELLESPLVVNEEKNSPLMKFVHLTNVLMPGARKLTPAPGKLAEDESPRAFSVLASTPEENPVYLQWDSPESKTLVLTAELKRGDLALRTAFPIMISNALNYFRGSGGELERSWSTSDSVVIPVSAADGNLLLRGPDSRLREFPVKSGLLAPGMLPKCGLWDVMMANGTDPIRQIACNLANAQESNLRSAPESFGKLENADSVHRAVNRPIWFWLVFAALIFSTLEWYLYQRRWID